MVRKVFEGAKALLSAAGLLPQFWPYAIRDYCFAENIKMVEGDSAWNRRFKKGHFRGPVIPFGCLVDFKQTPERADKMPKAAPDAVPGIMFGYKLNPGGVWNGEFYFVALREFADMDFPIWGSARNVSVQTVKEVWWDKKVVFPLLAKYHRANTTIEGIEQPRAGVEDCPPTVGNLQLVAEPPSVK